MNRARCLLASIAVVAALVGGSPVAAAPADPVVARISVGHPVFDPGFDGAFALGALWVSIGDDEIARIDPATNSIVATIAVGAGFRHEIAGGNGAIWVTNPDDNTVSRIDPGSNAVTGTFSSNGLDPIGVTTTPGAVWVANHHAPDGGTGSVVRLNPANGAVVAEIPLGGPFFEGGPGGMSANASGVWVTVPNLGSIVRINPATNEVDGSAPVQPCGIPSAASQYVLAPGAGCGGPYLGRVNASTLAVKKLNPGGIVRFAAAADGSGWATVTSSSCPPNCPPTRSKLTRIDLVSGDVLDKVALDGFGFVAIGAGSIWVGDGVAGQVLRVTP
jgi:hypothetical protein